MKKILGIFALMLGLFLTIITAEATTTENSTTWDSEAGLKRVNTIGTKIMKANYLPDNITFKVSDDESANAYANINKEVYVFKGLLNNVQNDDELAAVISHEIGHIVNNHVLRQTVVNGAIEYVPVSTQNQSVATIAQILKNLSSLKFSRNDEYEADLTAVDLMVKAEYNPLGLISVLNKICGNYVDILESHPSGEKRLMNIFDYANYNYPDIVKANYKTDSYQKALQFIYANLKDRNASPRKLKKAQKEQEKLKKKKIERAQKMINTNDPWDMSYSVLQVLQAQEKQ